jgi:hypothetical protein
MLKSFGELLTDDKLGMLKIAIGPLEGLSVSH